MEEKFVIGFEYGSDSARALVVNAHTGEILATAVKYYPRWKMGLYCNPKINQYRQHPMDYLEVLEDSVREILRNCPEGTAQKVIGIAFSTTGSTPCSGAGTSTSRGSQKRCRRSSRRLIQSGSSSGTTKATRRATTGRRCID